MAGRQGMRRVLAIGGGGFLMRHVMPATPKHGCGTSIALRGSSRNLDARLRRLVGGHSRRQEGKGRADQRR